MTDIESNGDVCDWSFEVNPTSYNSFKVMCRGDVNQAVWFYGQLRTKGAFKAGGYPANRLLAEVNDVAVMAMRNGQQDQVAVNNFIAHIGAIVA